MGKSKGLKVTDLRIGDKVRVKRTKFELIVTGIFWGLHDDPRCATLYLDFDSNEGEEWIMWLGEVEKVEE